MEILFGKITEEAYPLLLKHTRPLPEHLYVAGKIPTDKYKFLCVIGSRVHSSYGKEVCKKLISGLHGYPVVIVSGLAYGIDSLAHQTALETGLKTIAFPGSGLLPEVIYPAKHLNLARKIVEAGGALVSPFEPDQTATDWTFPVRNGLMAGISHATLIIEARHKSGTLITAEFAAIYGRDLLIVPGSIFSSLSEGSNELLREGGISVTSSEDILEALGLVVRKKKDDAQNPSSNQQVLPRLLELSLSPEEKILVDHLRIESLSASDLIERTGLASSALNILISQLELRGIIKESAGIWGVQAR